MTFSVHQNLSKHRVIMIMYVYMKESGYMVFPLCQNFDLVMIYYKSRFHILNNYIIHTLGKIFVPIQKI